MNVVDVFYRMGELSKIRGSGVDSGETHFVDFHVESGTASMQKRSWIVRADLFWGIISVQVPNTNKDCNASRKLRSLTDNVQK